MEHGALHNVYILTLKKKFVLNASGMMFTWRMADIFLKGKLIN
jgi:hypothetical protein